MRHQQNHFEQLLFHLPLDWRVECVMQEGFKWRNDSPLAVSQYTVLPVSVLVSDKNGAHVLEEVWRDLEPWKKNWLKGCRFENTVDAQVHVILKNAASRHVLNTLHVSIFKANVFRDLFSLQIIRKIENPTIVKRKL
jgi:hypothetical protein